MVYNYSKEKKKWEMWKEQEEQLLRSLNVDEDTISELREYDKQDFNKDRSFKRREYIKDDTFFANKPAYSKKEILNIEDMLLEIQSEALLLILSKTNKLTLSIVLFKMMGYTVDEIAIALHMKPSAVYKRIIRLRNDLYNNL